MLMLSIFSIDKLQKFVNHSKEFIFANCDAEYITRSIKFQIRNDNQNGVHKHRT